MIMGVGDWAKSPIPIIFIINLNTQLIYYLYKKTNNNK